MNVSWKFSLQKLHASDGQAHNDSHLCEILQVQSIQLCKSPNDQLSLEKRDVEKQLCDRCRRFTISPDEIVCKRCETVLKDMNFSTKWIDNSYEKINIMIHLLRLVNKFYRFSYVQIAVLIAFPRIYWLVTYLGSIRSRKDLAC